MLSHSLKRFTVLMGIVCMVLTSLPVEVMSSYRARVRVYVDKAGVDEFSFDNPGKDLSDHVKDMFVNVNKAYESLLPTVNVTLQLEQIISLDKNIFKRTMSWKDHLAVVHNSGLYQFWEWAKKTYDPKVYDLTILLTGFDIYGTTHTPNVFGSAYKGSVCSPNAAGIVEIQEPHGLVGLAHEIGHILGAEHDSDGPKRLCGRDSYKLGNLMNTYSQRSSPLVFTFSKCSTLQIFENFSNLTRNHRNCLRIPGDKSDTTPTLDITADELCARTKGEEWTMHRHSMDNIDEFCDSLDCVLPENDDRKISRITVPDGLKCGKNKRCLRGKCVYVDNGDPNMSDECPWGSQGNDYVTKLYRSTCAKLPCNRYGKMCCGDCTR